MPDVKIKSIIIKNFRNHEMLKIDSMNNKMVGFIDNNGSGKTNILEAISLFSPGNGIRNANLQEMPKNNAQEFFLSLEMINEREINQKIDIIYQNGKKKIIIDGKLQKSQMELKKIFEIIWMTPENLMNISIDKSFRRKFFDRIVFNFFPNHAELINNYDKLIKERLKILSANMDSNSWVDSIEKQIAEMNLKIAQNRNSAINLIKKEIANNNFDIDIIYECHIKNLSQEEIIDKLKANRKIDGHQMRTSFGCHRSNFNLLYLAKSIDIKTCSSGEKKYTIMHLLIAVAYSITNHLNKAPIILIDEFTSFIDKDFRFKIMDKLIELNSQIWITGTEKPDLQHEMLFYSISQLNI